MNAQSKKPFFFRWQEKKANQRMHACLNHDTVVETSSAKIHVYYSNKAKRPSLLMLHGMGVDAKTNWFAQIKYLSKHFNIIAPDLIYFGESTSQIKDYSVEFQAQQIHEMLLQLNLSEPVHVLGFSYGGLTAAVYNELFPNKESKLILVDAPVKFYSAFVADSMAKVAGVSTITDIIAPQSLQDFSALKRSVFSRKIPITKNMQRKILEHYFYPTREIREAQINYLQKQEKHYRDLNYNLATTKTLLIWGAEDGVVPLQVGQSIAASFPETCRLVVFKKAKHDIHFREPKQFNKLIVEFLTN